MNEQSEWSPQKLKVEAGRRLPFHLYQFKKIWAKMVYRTSNHWSNPNDIMMSRLPVKRRRKSSIDGSGWSSLRDRIARDGMEAGFGRWTCRIEHHDNGAHDGSAKRDIITWFKLGLAMTSLGPGDGCLLFVCRWLFFLIRGRILVIVTVDDEFRKKSLSDMWDFKYGIKKF